MNKAIDTISLAAALLGVILTIVSALARLFGLYYLGGFETMTVFNGGMGLMLISIVGKLYNPNRES